MLVESKIEAPWPWNMLLEYFFKLYPETMFKEMQPLCPSPKCGETGILSPPIYNAPDGLRLSMSKIDHLQIESRNPSF